MTPADSEATDGSNSRTTLTHTILHVLYVWRWVNVHHHKNHCGQTAIKPRSGGSENRTGHMITEWLFKSGYVMEWQTPQGYNPTLAWWLQLCGSLWWWIKRRGHISMYAVLCHNQCCYTWKHQHHPWLRQSNTVYDIIKDTCPPHFNHWDLVQAENLPLDCMQTSTALQL